MLSVAFLPFLPLSVLSFLHPMCSSFLSLLISSLPTNGHTPEEYRPQVSWLLCWSRAFMKQMPRQDSMHQGFIRGDACG